MSHKPKAYWHSKKECFEIKPTCLKCDLIFHGVISANIHYVKHYPKAEANFQKSKIFKNDFDETDMKIIESSIVSSIYKLNPTLLPKNLNAAVPRNVYN